MKRPTDCFGHGQHSLTELVPGLVVPNVLLRRMLASAFIVGRGFKLATAVDIQVIQITKT
jgi:hypothetical protein